MENYIGIFQLFQLPTLSIEVKEPIKDHFQLAEPIFYNIDGKIRPVFIVCYKIPRIAKLIIEYRQESKFIIEFLKKIFNGIYDILYTNYHYVGVVLFVVGCSSSNGKSMHTYSKELEINDNHRNDIVEYANVNMHLIKPKPYMYPINYVVGENIMDCIQIINHKIHSPIKIITSAYQDVRVICQE